MLLMILCTSLVRDKRLIYCGCGADFTYGYRQRGRSRKHTHTETQTENLEEFFLYSGGIHFSSGLAFELIHYPNLH